MNAEIITVGTESLQFPKRNLSADYINNALAGLGIQVIYRTRVDDVIERIAHVIQTATRRVDLVISVGGLGLAENDLTREALSEAIKRDLHIDKKILEKIIKKYETRGIALPEKVDKIAMVPEGGEALENKAGIIPGLFLRVKKCLIASMPGTMREIEAIMEFSFVPKIKQFLKDIILQRKVYHLFGVTELDVESKIKDIAEQENCSLTIHSSAGIIDLTLQVEGSASDKVEKRLSDIDEEIKRRLGMDLFGEGGETLESVVGKMLTEKGLSLGTAESCTGGLLSQKITDAPGSSQYFQGGVVSYTDQSKEEFLEIPRKEIEDYGAISEEVAKAMAEQAKRRMHTDYSISVTGIAGPAGGTAEKPVGLVFIGIAGKKKVQVEKLTLSGDRQTIRKTAVQKALDLLRRRLLSDEKWSGRE